MRAFAVTKSRVLLVLAMIAAGLAWDGPDASAATTTINLCALPGTATLTGAVTVPIWGFGVPTTPGDCSTATARLPGPLLTITISTKARWIWRSGLPDVSKTRRVTDLPEVLSAGKRKSNP